MFDLFSDPVKVAQQLEIITSEFGFATWETLYSLVLEVIFAYIIGLPLGVILVTGEKDGIRPLNPLFMRSLNVVINLLRSIPFLILMIIALPLSKVIVGTKVGTPATIPPMVVCAFPLVARMVESSLRELDQGVVEAAQSMGASPLQIVWKVYLPEAKPSLILGGAISIVTILAYTAIAGAVGAGGLGDLAIRYGYQRRVPSMMWVTVVFLIVLVQVIQYVFSRVSTRIDKRLK
jgi:D-methionine transport system permease protein